MISYLFGFAVISVGMNGAGFNLAATSSTIGTGHDVESSTDLRVVHYRHGGLLTLASPVLLAPLFVSRQDGADRVLRHEHGGSSYLWRTCSGSSGTRRSTSWRCGLWHVGEILPVFTRKPLSRSESPQLE